MISSKKGFTLVELMIVIVIMTMMLVLSYAPYSYFQDKAKLKISSSEISQGILDGRSLAISGVNTASGDIFTNKSVGVFLDNREEKNGKIYFYTYPYETLTGSLVFPDKNDKLLKTKSLQDGVLINGSGSLLFFFEAITGKSTVFLFENETTKKLLTGSVDITFSFKNSDSESLKKIIKYNTETNIVNY